MNSIPKHQKWMGVAAMICVFPLVGCEILGGKQGVAQPESIKKEDRLTTVDVLTAPVGTLEDPLEYVGTTEPIRTVRVRSQVQGTLLNLAVEIGDPVNQGQVLGKIDDILLGNLVSQEKAELASVEAELAQAKIQINNAKIQLEQFQLQAQQAQADANRLSRLSQVGAIPIQQAETAQTTFKVAQKNVLAAQEQIRLSQQAATAILGRIATQKAVIAENEQRQSYAIITAPITGFILKRNEPGNLINSGDEIVEIGNLNQVKIVVEVSELDLKNIYLEQIVELTLDAFSDQFFVGKVKQISPVADAETRKLEVKIAIDNENHKIRGGLLARVRFKSEKNQRIILPSSAVIKSDQSPQVFTIKTQDNPEIGQVEQKEIQIGQQLNGKVEIIKGIQAGEKVIVNSSKPLQDSEIVKLSILSDGNN